MYRLHSQLSYIQVTCLSQSITQQVSLSLLFGIRLGGAYSIATNIVKLFGFRMTRPKQIFLVIEPFIEPFIEP